MNYYIKIFLEFIRNPSKALKIVRNRIRVSLGIYVRHDKKIIDSIRWLTDKGEESIHNFPLNADSVVVLIGGYKGDVTEELSKRFDCHIYVFEPVYEFFKILESRFSKNNKIKCFNYGCGESNRFQRISIDGTATSIYKPKTNDKNENVEVRRFDRDLLERLRPAWNLV